MTKGKYQHKPMSEETKQKIRLALQGKPKSEEHIMKVKIANTGKKRSLESRIKQSTRMTTHGISYDGYKRIFTPAGYRMKEHDYLMEQYIHRKLEKNECVHHLNGIKTDNRIENLQLMTKSEHQRIHALKNGLGKVNHTVWNKGLTKATDVRLNKCTGRKKLSGKTRVRA